MLIFSSSSHGHLDDLPRDGTDPVARACLGLLSQTAQHLEEKVAGADNLENNAINNRTGDGLVAPIKMVIYRR